MAKDKKLSPIERHSWTGPDGTVIVATMGADHGTPEYTAKIDAFIKSRGSAAAPPPIAAPTVKEKAQHTPGPVAVIRPHPPRRRSPRNKELWIDVVAQDVTEHCFGIPAEVSRVYDVYLVNMEVRTFICDAQPKAELYHLQHAFTLSKHGEVAWEQDSERVHDSLDEYRYALAKFSERVCYVHHGDVERYWHHLARIKFKPESYSGENLRGERCFWNLRDEDGDEPGKIAQDTLSEGRIKSNLKLW